jgi:hypothetical protein
MTGNKKHQMDFVSDSYGGVKKNDASNDDKQQGADLPIISASLARN